MIGASLDGKIDTFLQLLMTLKSLKSHQERHDSTLVRLIDSLVSSISRIVHGLTEDTRALGDVKVRLEESAPSGRQPHQEALQARNSDLRIHGKEGSQADLPQSLAETSQHSHEYTHVRI